MSDLNYDVAIIGGGPAGTTIGSLLKKYQPDWDVLIVEREVFPRDHVGESQLPPIGAILDEMGCWDKVEAADFPIKIGATYRWGQTPQLWDFDFIPVDEFQNRPRPTPYNEDRKLTALQVDRARYDEILLRHSETLGCDVIEGCGVKKVHHADDQVESLELQDSRSIHAKYFVDASGHTGFLRRAMDVKVDSPTALKNIAIWDYWENADWADEIGVGGTRVQVLSQANGWIWFIPLGPTRTSIGLICPVSYYKESGKSAEELYYEGLKNEQVVAELTTNATSRGEIETTTDWSFLAERTYGKNWFLVGESAGFADPILAAGMTLAHGSARECAYTILELERGTYSRDWLVEAFNSNQRNRIQQHIRFADFWYASNGQFEDLQEHCREIAEDSGLELTPQEAWQWIAQGGFTHDVPGQAVVGGFFDIAGAKQCAEMFTDGEISWETNAKNIFKLNLDGAEESKIPIYENGAIKAVECYHRNGKRLPKTGINLLLVAILQKTSDIAQIVQTLIANLQKQFTPDHAKQAFSYSLQALEVLVSEGWVEADFDPTRPKLNIANAKDSKYIKMRD